jgi:hypothetical protein
MSAACPLSWLTLPPHSMAPAFVSAPGFAASCLCFLPSIVYSLIEPVLPIGGEFVVMAADFFRICFQPDAPPVDVANFETRNFLECHAWRGVPQAKRVISRIAIELHFGEIVAAKGGLMNLAIAAKISMGKAFTLDGFKMPCGPNLDRSLRVPGMTGLRCAGEFPRKPRNPLRRFAIAAEKLFTPVSPWSTRF